MEDILKSYPHVMLLEKIKDENTKYINNYKIIKTISKGHFSKVILCQWQNNFYILKKYNLKWLEKKREFIKNGNNEIIIRSKLDDLKEEIRMLNDINNPYCLGCDKIITDYETKLYILSEYYENESILKYDQNFFVFEKDDFFFIPLPVIKCIIKSILKALNYLHKKKNICHRDVKPSNVLLSKTGEIKLTDFGEAQYMKNNSIKGTKGTYEFMPPEFFSKEIFYDGEKTDMWSLGISLYAMFYRVLPFKMISSLLQLFEDISKCDIPYFKKRNHLLLLQTQNESVKKNKNDLLSEKEKLKENVKEKENENENENELSDEDINFLKNILKKDPYQRYSSEEALVRKRKNKKTKGTKEKRKQKREET